MVKDDLLEYCLRLGDNALVTGQQFGAWVRNSPTIELDVAFGNFGLDYIGQSRLLLTYAGEVEGKGRDEDKMAFLRDGWDFRNVLMAELPNGDFAFTMLRLFFYSAWLKPYYEKLMQSKDERLAAIAAKAVQEVEYHLKHSAEWVVRLGDGTEESHRRIEAALAALWPYTAELFEADELDVRMAEQGIGVDPSTLYDGWIGMVDDVLARATLSRPDDPWKPTGGKQGRHTEHLGYLLAEMQSMQRTYPNCEW
ncbi:MAG: phenylacetate-CoA oxygenase subunit PaaC [Fimbriimonadaceae bacterium]|nr:phenylacetate-CoA oxygenase subunit PaaC [Alphaproteobacteria bacterium]